MPSNKKLKDLEYNVFGKDLDDTPETFITPKNAGCATMLAGIVVTVLVIVVIVGFMQIGKNGPAPHCAYPGCSNRLKPGSNYCWLHSSTSTGSRRSGSSSGGLGSSSSSGNGSVIGGSSSDSSSKKNSKIWSGSGRESSSGGSGSSISD